MKKVEKWKMLLYITTRANKAQPWLFQYYLQLLVFPHLYSDVCVCRLCRTLTMCSEIGLTPEGKHLFKLMFLPCQILHVLSLSIWCLTVCNKLSAVLQLTGLSTAVCFVMHHNSEVITSDIFFSTVYHYIDLFVCLF